MKGLVKIYQNFIKTYPVFSNAVQTATLMATGDLIAQTVVEQRQLHNINLKRTIQFASVGFVLVGPVLSNWYRLLSRMVGEESKVAGLKKMALDQICFAPCFLYIFLVTTNLVQGFTFLEAKNNVSRDYIDIVINNYRLWPVVQLVNFCFVPLPYQVLLVQTVAIIWNTYLSWKTQIKT
ncbi:protein Mpv17 [Agrilus planipennis]|uniref:Mitochondrial inner membrane protein Mpv17 n=1 Tax=Agrilus planipennis TaxID=224129 RepID=A0A1W4XKJ9_AGRPL|nr:protein Mpv17 [Agrilus planipennis]